LAARGAGRWTLEAKPPTFDITPDDIDQAWSYAVNADVRAAYFVLCNGRRFLICKTLQGPDAEPFFQTTYDDLLRSLQVISNILGASSFARSIRSDHNDTGRPLARHLGSTSHIVAGQIEYHAAAASNPAIQAKFQSFMGLRIPVDQGYVWRDRDRIFAKIQQGFLHRLWQEAATEWHSGEFIYECSDETISEDANRPNIFESRLVMEVRRDKKVSTFKHSLPQSWTLTQP
jgi:hypothetical protein